MRRPFLTARWSNLCLFTYAVPPSLLEPRLPPGLTLDLRDGQAFVSLVAFDFLETKVLGIGWPGFRNFPEVNLRFYARRGEGERGVVFIREYVPLRTVAYVAQAIYNEPYVAAPMRKRIVDKGETVEATYEIARGDRTHRIGMAGRRPTRVPPADGVEHFFKEHTWGYGRDTQDNLLRYEVDHPHWALYALEGTTLDVDFRILYGDEWAFLGDATPYSTIFAVGSEVAVYPHGRVEPG